MLNMRRLLIRYVQSFIMNYINFEEFSYTVKRYFAKIQDNNETHCNYYN